MEKIDSSRKQPIRDIVYHNIRNAILRGELKPGERLNEEHLAAQLGISRTPVREALRKLEVEKMVSHSPYRGVVITEINTDETDDLYEIRTLVEAIIAKRAALNATPDDIKRLEDLLDVTESTTDPGKVSGYVDQYNHAIAEVANCPHISDFATKLRMVLSRMIVHTYLSPRRRADAQREHREIVAAIALGDSALAQKLTIEHVRKASQYK